MVISCLVNIVQGGGGGGGVLPRFGMLENSPKTVKCVITFETDCMFQFHNKCDSNENPIECMTMEVWIWTVWSLKVSMYTSFLVVIVSE